MKQILTQRLKKLNNSRGVALVVIIMVLVVTTILGASAVSMVYSDNMFSQHQEETRKAQYAARSAVTVVEKAIADKLEELEAIENQLQAAISAYLSSTTEAEVASNLAAMQAKEAERDSLRDQIFGTASTDIVLPYDTVSDVSHTVQVTSSEEFDVDSGNEFTVTIEKIGTSGNKYRIESLTTLSNGDRTAKGKAVRQIVIESNPVVLSTLLPTGWFEDALWAKDTITVGNNNHVIQGNVTFGSGSTPSALEMDPGYHIRKRDPSEELPPAPSAFFTTLVSSSPAIGTTTSATFFTPSGSNKNITTANNAYYNNTITNRIKFNDTYTVNTTTADVIQHIDFAEIDANNVTFNVSGANDYILYIGNIASPKATNNVTFKATGGADIYLIFDGDASNLVKNNIYGSNLYIYAPNSDLEFKNNIGGEGNGQGTYTGAIIGKTIKIKNNADIKYQPTKPGKNTLFNRTGSSGGGDEDAEATIYHYSPYFSGKWLKN